MQQCSFANWDFIYLFKLGAVCSKHFGKTVPAWCPALAGTAVPSPARCHLQQKASCHTISNSSYAEGTSHPLLHILSFWLSVSLCAHKVASQRQRPLAATAVGAGLGCASPVLPRASLPFLEGMGLFHIQCDCGCFAQSEARAVFFYKELIWTFI